MSATDVLLASSAATGIAIAAGGIAAVLAVSAVFYVIGRGEDRERSQAPPPAPPGCDAPPPPDEPPPAARDEHPRLASGARSRRRRR